MYNRHNFGSEFHWTKEGQENWDNEFQCVCEGISKAMLWISELGGKDLPWTQVTPLMDRVSGRCMSHTSVRLLNIYLTV